MMGCFLSLPVPAVTTWFNLTVVIVSMHNTSSTVLKQVFRKGQLKARGSWGVGYFVANLHGAWASVDPDARHTAEGSDHFVLAGEWILTPSCSTAIYNIGKVWIIYPDHIRSLWQGKESRWGSLQSTALSPELPFLTRRMSLIAIKLQWLGKSLYPDWVIKAINQPELRGLHIVWLLRNKSEVIVQITSFSQSDWKMQGQKKCIYTSITTEHPWAPAIGIFIIWLRKQPKYPV